MNGNGLTDVFLHSHILAFLKDHRGLERAVPREYVLSYIRQWDEKITDRELRAAYSMMPEICSCDKGLYLPASTADLQEFERYMRKQALPHFERVKRVRGAYPHLAPGRRYSGRAVLMPKFHPQVPHYDHSQVQPIDFMESNFAPDEYRGFCKGQIVKYIAAIASRVRHLPTCARRIPISNG